MDTLREDQSLYKTKQAEVAKGSGAYEELQARSKASENAVLAAQQHFQAVTAGLSSGVDGQEKTLAAQKIGMLERWVLCYLESSWMCDNWGEAPHCTGELIDNCTSSYKDFFTVDPLPACSGL